MIGISGSLIWSKTQIELIFNPCGEFRWSPEAQLAKSTSWTLEFFQIFKVNSDAKERERERERESWVRKAMVSYRTYSSLVKLQPWFLSLQWKTCHWAEHSGDDISIIAITSWLLEYSVLYFLHAFSFQLTTRWNRYRSSYSVPAGFSGIFPHFCELFKWTLEFFFFFHLKSCV